MPISLGDVAAKLDRLEFANLSGLESYILRMVQNARDYYAASSPQSDDAERIRKAAAGFMAKHNPAYRNPDYEAVPTPIPGDDEDDEDAQDDDAEKGEHEEDNEGDDDENDDDDEDAPRANHTPGRRKSSATSRVVLVSRDTPTRVGRKGSAAPTAVSGSKLPDHEYAGVPYKGLTFQQAQEKVVEEIIRRPDEEDATYAYFEPFFNLPPRTLKDYFQVIKDPLSIKKLQKLVKGIRSRTDRPGVTEYKSWAAFEDRASLLWDNAYFYNEDGSPIANMARELEAMFRDELRAAKAAVPEPPQPKIKIKKGAKDTPAATTKKITIHVAHTRGPSADSPKAKAGSASVVSDTPAHDRTARGAARNASPSPSVVAAAARAGSASVSATVVAATKRESSSRASPALSPHKSSANGTAASDAAPTNGTPSVAASTANGAGPAESAVPPPPPAPAVPLRPAYESKFRPAGSGEFFDNIECRCPVLTE